MGLTQEGLKARILDKDFTLASQEAIDLFYMFPDNVVVEWKNKEIEKVEIMGLNIEFKMRK